MICTTRNGPDGAPVISSPHARPPDYSRTWCPEPARMRARTHAYAREHKTKQVSEFLDRHANVHLHFTPTYSSWLNQVELWFARIERDVIARGVFTSVPDLRQKLMRYIRQYIKAPKTRSRPRRAIFHPAVASHQCIAPDVVHRRPFARSCVHG